MIQMIALVLIYGVMMFIWTFVFLNRSHDKVNQSFLVFLSNILVWMVLNSSTGIWRRNDDHDRHQNHLLVEHDVSFHHVFVLCLSTTQKKIDGWFCASFALNTLTVIVRYLCRSITPINVLAAVRSRGCAADGACVQPACNLRALPCSAADHRDQGQTASAQAARLHPLRNRSGAGDQRDFGIPAAHGVSYRRQFISDAFCNRGIRCCNLCVHHALSSVQSALGLHLSKSVSQCERGDFDRQSFRPDHQRQPPLQELLQDLVGRRRARGKVYFDTALIPIIINMNLHSCETDKNTILP